MTMETIFRGYRIPKDIVEIVKRRAEKLDITESKYVIRILKRECLRKR